MGTIKDKIIDIEFDINEGKLSFPEIAKKHEVPEYFVTDIWNFMCETEYSEE